MRNKTNRIW